MKQAGALYHISGVPNAKQAQFFASRARFTAYGGARGGGKSWALRRKLLGLCLNYPGIRCLLVRRTRGELRNNHILPMLREYGTLLTYSAGESALLCRNGSRIDCGYCDCEQDTLRYQGLEYDIIALDEATQLSEMQFLALKSCLRGVRNFPRRMYLTCNPGGVGHAWVKRLFIDRVFRAGENPEDYYFIPARVWDNEILMREDPAYVDQLRSLPDRLRAAWLDGRWDIFDGQFFPEFREESHVRNPAELPDTGELFGAMDYGFDRLVFLLCREREDGLITVHEELCRSGLTLGEAAVAVAERCGNGRVKYIAASPDLWNRRQDSGRSGISVMQASAELPPLLPADDRRIPGWRLVHEYLHVKEGEKGPRLLVASSCRELISCMQALQCHERIPEDAADRPHALTHAPEALRYALMSRAGGRERVEESYENPFRFPGQNHGSIWD